MSSNTDLSPATRKVRRSAARKEYRATQGQRVLEDSLYLEQVAPELAQAIYEGTMTSKEAGEKLLAEVTRVPAEEPGQVAELSAELEAFVTAFGEKHQGVPAAEYVRPHLDFALRGLRRYHSYEHGPNNYAPFFAEQLAKSDWEAARVKTAAFVEKFSNWGPAFKVVQTRRGPAVAFDPQKYAQAKEANKDRVIH